MLNLGNAIKVLGLVFLAGCSNNERPIVDPNGSNSSPPDILRIVPQEQLSASVRVNFAPEQTYFGSDFAQGNWQIPVELIPDESNNIIIRWYFGELLLLEEFADYFWDPAQSTVKPNFAFTTSGEQRFDDDCDGISNLSELYADTNPLVANGSSMECLPQDPPTDIDMNSTSIARVIANSQSFVDGGYAERITEFEIPLFIKKVRSDGRVAFISQLGHRQPNGVVTQLFIALENIPGEDRYVTIFSARAVAASESSAAGSNCFKVDTDRPDKISFAQCNLPFAWEEDRWYVLRLQEVSPQNENNIAQWEASILDQETSTRLPIGTISINPRNGWQFSGTFIDSRNKIAHSQCVNGIETSAYQFKQATVNGDHSADYKPVDILTECMFLGAGYNSSVRRVDEEFLYSMSLGRL